ncbi:uncharacterized protein [Nicotiana tomentosiformis]|uniref:uncharacterized protein n=1 Tax=Nicotiana tomentosiformis TaxID=4098 RepID=UPI00388CD2A1
MVPVLVLPTGSGSYTVYCDASRIGLGILLMQDDRVIAYALWKVKVHEKSYPIPDLELEAIVHALKIWRKSNVVADAFSRRIVSMGSLAYIPVRERPLSLYVQALANQFLSMEEYEQHLRVLLQTLREQ